MAAATAVLSTSIERTSEVNPWLIAITVTLATFMELLDTAIANVSLPHIAGGLATSYDESTWVLTSYLVANAVVLPLSAWLSRVFGRKNYYMSCVALFSVSSLMCGLAPSLGLLISFRVLQGIAGGGLAPVEQAILVDTFPASKRAAAFALYSMAIVTAPAVGPPLGGWITDSFSWRWVFFINVPIGIISLVLTSRLLSDPPEFKQEVEAARQAGRFKVDYLGIVLIALGFACLEVVLDRGERLDWFESNFIVAFFAVAIVALVVAVVWELRQQDPVVELKLLRERNFAFSNVFYFLFGFVRFDRADSTDAAVTLWLYSNRCWLSFGSRRNGDRRYGTPDRPTGEEDSDVMDDWVWFHRPRVRYVVLRELQSCNRLRKRSLGTRGSGLRDRLLVCPDQPTRLLLFAQE
jgi:DHA2 family multidrug resistance protein